MDCGDFLRRCLKKISEKTSPSKSYQSPKETFDCKNIQNTVNGNKTISHQQNIANSVLESEDIKSLFQLSLEWKFECPACRRYIVSSIKVNLYVDQQYTIDSANLMYILIVCQVNKDVNSFSIGQCPKTGWIKRGISIRFAGQFYTYKGNKSRLFYTSN